MAAQRCSLCGINFPLGYERCQVCDTNLDRMQNATVDDDWQIRVERASPLIPAHPLTEIEKVENWRLESALRLGYTVDVAESIAADTSVELNLLRVLVERNNVPLELAVRIA